MTVGTNESTHVLYNAKEWYGKLAGKGDRFSAVKKGNILGSGNNNCTINAFEKIRHTEGFVTGPGGQIYN